MLLNIRRNILELESRGALGSEPTVTEGIQELVACKGGKGLAWIDLRSRLHFDEAALKFRHLVLAKCHSSSQMT